MIKKSIPYLYLAFSILFFLPLVSSNIVYQENANWTSESPSNMKWNNLSAIFDGNWNTYSSMGAPKGGNYNALSLSYKIPGWTTSANWQIKDGRGTRNLTIPSACLNDSELKLWIFTHQPSSAQIFNITYSCRDSSSSYPLDSYLYSGYYMINLYEEKMIWNTLTCISNSQCGTDHYVGQPFCTENNRTQNYETFSCSPANSCSSSISPMVLETCQFGCSNGACNPDPRIPVSYCRIINESGNYVLDNDIDAASDCIIIQNTENVTLDMADFLINGGLLPIKAVSVLNSQNVLIKNGALLNSQYGIYATGSNSLEISDITFDSNNYSISLTNSPDSKISDSRFTNTKIIPLSASNSNYLLIENNTLIGASTSNTGFSLQNINHSIIRKNTINNVVVPGSPSTGKSVLINTGTNLTLSENNINNTCSGIYSSYLTNSTISNNFISDCSCMSSDSIGIYAENSYFVLVKNNNLKNLRWDGIYFGFGSDNALEGNIIDFVQSDNGIYIRSESRDQINNNSIFNISGGGSGFFALTLSDSSISNNQILITGFGAATAAIMSNCARNHLRNNYFYSESGRALQISNSQNNLLEDSTFIGSWQHVFHGLGFNNTFLNCTYAFDSFWNPVGLTYMERQWHFDIKTINNLTGVPEENVSVSFYNLSDTLMRQGTTNSEGIAFFNITQYYAYNSSLFFDVSQYKVVISKPGFKTKTLFYNVITNRYEEIQMEDAKTYINSCRTITEPGEYILQNDLPHSSLSSPACFTIQNTKDVTLDLNSHSLVSNGDSSFNGVYILGSSSVTVKNGNLQNFGMGIYSQNSNNTRIKNNTVQNSQDMGIYFEMGFNNIIEENSVDRVISAGSNGIYIYLETGDIIKKNSISNIDAEGLLIHNCFYSEVLENTITGSFACRIQGSGVNHLKNNYFSTINDVLSLRNTQGNIIEDSTFISSSGRDVVHDGSLMTTLLNCTYSSESFSNSNYMERQWHLDVKVVDVSGIPQENAFVEVYNISDSLIKNGTTNSEGMASFNLTQYFQTTNLDKTPVGPYKVKVSKDGYNIPTITPYFNMTNNKFMTLAVQNISLLRQPEITTEIPETLPTTKIKTTQTTGQITPTTLPPKIQTTSQIIILDQEKKNNLISLNSPKKEKKSLIKKILDVLI